MQRILILLILLTLVSLGILGGFEFVHQRGATLCINCMGLG